MPRQYFRLNENLYIPGRWELDELHNGTGARIDGLKLKRGEPTDFDGIIQISIFRTGAPLDFSHLVSAPVPVVSRRVAEVVTNLAANDVQLLPARVASQSDEYYVVNARRTVQCIDDKRSKGVQYWRPEDGRPEKVGEYRDVFEMRVNPDQIPSDVKIFRPQGWTIVLLISEEIRDALERIGATGTQFTPV